MNTPNAAPASADALDIYTAGIAALGRQDWAEAVRLFETVIQESDTPELTGRARQFLATSRQKLARNQQEDRPTGDDDPYLRALFEKNRGDFRQALELCRQDGREQKDDRFAYLAASIHALEGRPDDAVQTLTRAVELNPKNRIHAFHDADFADLRRNRDLRPLFGLS
ncbi:MAG TPA: tetratricopeptide repeat protein [Thermoanaerobaculia bacterium]|nr:tetratricopeptide repeat protein [Thermoanaerobaculia bacterium]